MFSFHKPKVYRSSTGCCICKAKSSSSRFTDSKKYEEDFIKCFVLEERRTGEICNACVLLVKRWKKLPEGSGRNWRHVVDARAGPGIKSLTKFKAKNKKKTLAAKKKQEERDDSYDSEENVVGTGSKSSSRAGSPASSEDNVLGEKRLDTDQTDSDISNLIDLTYFKRKNVCCGAIFIGLAGEVLVEPSLYKPCLSCVTRQQQQRERAASVNALTSSPAGSSPAHSSASASPCHSSASASPAHSVDSMVSTDSKSSSKSFGCDSSSDSGYDDTSNPGENKKLQLLLQPPTPSVLQLLAKPGKPTVKLQQPAKTEPLMPTIISAPTSIRLKGLTSTKVPIKLLCKPVALVSSAKLSLAGGGSVLPPAVDFAVRPPPQRQSLAN